MILGDFCKTKVIRDTSLISTVIWSYVTTFLNWRKKDEWNSLEGSRAPHVVGKTFAYVIMGKKKTMHSTK